LQWIYRNFTLHDKLCGYLHNKSLEDIKQTIEELAETPPEDIPKGSNLFIFFTLLFPICPSSRIEGDKCNSVNGVDGDTRMPYFSTLTLAQFTNVYASMSDSGSGMGHEWNPTSTSELVH
jgi:hypothetical protein